MKPEQQKMEQLKARIEPLLNKVPQSVANGSIETVRAFKAAVTDARKAVGGSRATLASLQSALQKLESYQ